MKIAPARLAAFEILSQIERGTAHSSALLPEYEARLESADRRLCHELVLGVLRRQILFDRQIDVLTGGRKIDLAVRIILRLALYQLSFLDRIPAHAAVNDAVNLAVTARKTSAKSFINAVLRKFQKETPTLEFMDRLDRLSVETSHPRPLLERWVSEFGDDAAESIARFDNETPSVEYRWTLKSTEAVRRSLERSDIPNRSDYLRELAGNGKIYFQDRGSQLIAEAVNLTDGERFLDLCAAPGGKTTLIALHAYGRRNLLVAGDVNWKRVTTLVENCRIQGASEVKLLQCDAAALPFAERSFDVVLVDAPCSGTGTIRHNPEIRYRWSEAEMFAIAEKQLAILENASKLVRPGGRIIYSTCSLESAENENVCAVFEQKGDGFRRVEPELPDEFLTADGFGRTVPFRDKTDGFFIAMYRRS